jgi:hypothetical protein
MNPITAEEAAQLAGRAIADGLAFCAVPVEDGYQVWRGQPEGVQVKVERSRRMYGLGLNVLVFCEPRGNK